ncbi:hypothetical protein PAHAL_2G311300 [Panicum hallii]|jgi:hypothetical protein|uniref:Uncharacterized protein n=1 Tax=Panicum hallii TaxID=206008 RepID=A0A2T8KR10_9POAL|nr:hypothetical protein PAHAL_2G311300 [Panicum hallii]
MGTTRGARPVKGMAHAAAGPCHIASPRVRPRTWTDHAKSKSRSTRPHRRAAAASRGGAACCVRAAVAAAHSSRTEPPSCRRSPDRPRPLAALVGDLKSPCRGPGNVDRPVRIRPDSCRRDAGRAGAGRPVHQPQPPLRPAKGCASEATPPERGGERPPDTSASAAGLIRFQAGGPCLSGRQVAAARPGPDDNSKPGT